MNREITSFNSHGEHKVKVIDRCVFVTHIGAYNKEGAQDVFSSMKKVVRDNFGGKISWGCIIDLSLFELATPDVGEVVDEIYRWSASNGQEYEATIVTGAMQRELASAYSQKSAVECKIFNSKEDALAWFRQLGLIN